LFFGQGPKRNRKTGFQGVNGKICMNSEQ
jgi:hypothetical protein